MDHAEEDDDAPVPCDLCGQSVPFNLYAAHSVQCSMMLRPVAPVQPSTTLRVLRTLTQSEGSSSSNADAYAQPMLLPMPSPWLMWYSAAVNAVADTQQVEQDNQRRTWLTFLHFTNDAATAAAEGSGGRGMSRESIDTAIGQVAEDRVGTFVRDDMCPVCLDPFLNRTPERPLAQINRCGHVFCASCITTWLEQHGTTCPVCKCSVDGSDDNSTAARAEREAEQQLVIEIALMTPETGSSFVEDDAERGVFMDDGYGDGDGDGDDGNNYGEDDDYDYDRDDDYHRDYYD